MIENHGKRDQLHSRADDKAVPDAFPKPRQARAFPQTRRNRSFPQTARSFSLRSCRSCRPCRFFRIRPRQPGAQNLRHTGNRHDSPKRELKPALEQKIRRIRQKKHR